ncbi:MAG: hypothetical protein ACUVWP_06030 [bacterium]
MQTLFNIDENKKELGFPLNSQIHIINALNRAIEKDMLATSYIFDGKPGSGRYELASQFAMALMCRNENKIPSCGTCVHCLKIDKGVHPDLIEIKGKERSIKIDEVRYIISEVYRKPNEANRKVIIIRDAERMTIETANALLKVFEEPPLTVVIVLTICDPTLIPQTVISRSIHLHLKPIERGSLIKHISRLYEINEEEAVVILSISNNDIHILEELMGNKNMYESIVSGDFFKYIISSLNPQGKNIDREVAIKLINLILYYIRYKREVLNENLYAKLLYLFSSTGKLLRGNTNVKVVLYRLMFELKEMTSKVKGGVNV